MQAFSVWNAIARGSILYQYETVIEHLSLVNFLIARYDLRASGTFNGTSTGLIYFATTEALCITFNFPNRKENCFSSYTLMALNASCGRCQSSFLKGPNPFFLVL
jgi:hypothetical protein